MASETSPRDNLKYKSADYWNERYQTEDNYEWLCDFASVAQFITPHLHAKSRILNLGCGNSVLSQDLYQAGYHNICNLDYSAELIGKLEQKYRDTHPEMTWVAQDMRHVTFEPGSFDVVIEKATFDSLLVDENPWSRSQDSIDAIASILTRISGCLKPNGVFISITFTQPHFRLRDYCREVFGWSVELNRVQLGFEYFVYVMRKGKKLETDEFADLLKLTDERNDVLENAMMEQNDGFIFDIKL